MRKIYLFVLGFAFALASCNTEEPAPVDPGASKCYITAVRVNSFPSSDNGSQWDVSTGDDQKADITFSISNSAEIIYEHEYYFPDLSVDSLPATFTQINYLLPTMDQPYGLFLYDRDVTSGDDYVGAEFFNPDDHKKERPEFINLSGTEINVDVFFNWED